MVALIYTVLDMAAEARTENFIFRLSKSEHRMLHLVAEMAGLSLADVLRQAIRRDYAEWFGDTPPQTVK